MRIDAHTHFFPKAFLTEIGRRGAAFQMETRTSANGEVELIMKGVPHPPLKAFHDVDEHFQHMTRNKIDAHVVWQSSRPNVFWADAQLGLDLCQIINDEYADLEANYPGKFYGIASVPLQDIPKAVDELVRAIEKKKLRGVMANTNIRGRYLDDAYLWPLYEALEELQVPLFVHPANPYGADKLRDFHTSFLLGLPADTTLAVVRLIFSGTLDRFPGLRLFIPHGGGLLPYLIGRIGHGYKVRPECKNIERAPHEYLDRMLFDTIVFDPEILKFVAGTGSVRRLALGSDFPYDMADGNPVGTIDAAIAESAERDLIYSRNIVEFLNLGDLAG